MNALLSGMLWTHPPIALEKYLKSDNIFSTCSSRLKPADMIKVTTFYLDNSHTSSKRHPSFNNMNGRLKHRPLSSPAKHVNRAQRIVCIDSVSSIHKPWPGCVQSTWMSIERRRQYVLLWQLTFTIGAGALTHPVHNGIQQAL